MGCSFIKYYPYCLGNKDHDSSFAPVLVLLFLNELARRRIETGMDARPGERVV